MQSFQLLSFSYLGKLTVFHYYTFRSIKVTVSHVYIWFPRYTHKLKHPLYVNCFRWVPPAGRLYLSTSSIFCCLFPLAILYWTLSLGFKGESVPTLQIWDRMSTASYSEKQHMLQLRVLDYLYSSGLMKRLSAGNAAFPFHPLRYILLQLCRNIFPMRNKLWINGKVWMFPHSYLAL